MSEPARSRTLRWYLSVIAVSMAVLVVVIDTLIVPVALPYIAQSLGLDVASSTMVVTSAQVAIAILLFPLASLGEFIGYRRLFLGGLAAFGAGALGCAFADSLDSLRLFRALQGAGAAAVLAVVSPLIRIIYPLERLGVGLSVNSTIVAASLASGPILAGVLLAAYEWPSIFLIGLPAICISAWIGWRTLPDHQRRGRLSDFDISGSLLSMLTIGAGLLFVKAVAIDRSIGAWGGWLLLFISSAVLFFLQQRRQYLPLFPLDVLRDRPVRLAVAGAFAFFVMEMGAFVGLPYALSRTLEDDTVAIGTAITCWPLAIMLVALPIGRLADRHSLIWLSTFGMLLGALGLFQVAALEVGAAWSVVALWLAVSGAGFAFFQIPNNRLIIASAPPERAGSVSGLVGTTRLTGQTIGASLAGFVLGHFSDDPTAMVLCAAALAVIVAVISASRALVNE